MDSLTQIHFVVTNHFNELVTIADGKNCLQKFFFGKSMISIVIVGIRN